MKKIVPDSSVLIDGRIMKYFEENPDSYHIIIPEAVLAEIKAMAGAGKSTGRTGLKELREVRELADANNWKLEVAGERPTAYELENSHLGVVDDLIKDVALEYDAILITADKVQRDSHLVCGGKVHYLRYETLTSLSIEDFFDENTMSVHIKGDMPVHAKKGKPGNFELSTVSDVIPWDEVEEIARNIVERARADRESFIEMDESGATVVQLRNYRIAITRPPFSDRVEITAVRPVRKLTLEDYSPSPELMKRLKSGAFGILVAGSPGAGKSTFVQALAEYYHSQNRIVKTMEKPRDLNVCDDIIQYTALGGSMEKTGDILLLVRPDYTIFDEMRTTDDFKVYADLRLAGVGMVGVMHATRGIDAVQRMIGRVELGTIPQVIDTVIYIDAGQISEVYQLEYTVKVPSGMTQQDLARPVIEVKNFATGELAYEIYSFGEQIVAVPVKLVDKENRLLKLGVKSELDRLLSGINYHLKMMGAGTAVLYVDDDDIPEVIGRGGSRVNALEKALGLHIDVKPIHEFRPTAGSSSASQEDNVDLDVVVKSKFVILTTPRKEPYTPIEIFVGSREVFSGSTDQRGKVKISKRSDAGKAIVQNLKAGKKVTAHIYR